MEFTSILDLHTSPDRDEPRPSFFLDLNLDQIIQRIDILWGRKVAPFYYYLPADKASEDYRREVMADVKDNGLYEILCSFVKDMELWREAAAKKEAVHMELQQLVWHVWEAGAYCRAFTVLSQALEPLQLSSRGFLAFRSYLKQYISSESFREMRAEAESVLEKFDSIHLVLSCENGRLSVSQGEVDAAYDCFLEESFPEQSKKMRNPFGMDADLTELEQELMKLVGRQRPEVFKGVELFCRNYPKYARDALLQFAEEIEYYLSFYCFRQEMEGYGYAFCAPTVSESGELSAEGLYDLALACVSCGGQREVVSNDMYYGAEERFFVLTGPNQGGKTTFARSLGQLVYFSKMGLDVPARKADMCYFTGILTHFSVEESLETGRGKLKEELVRLAPMMDTAYTGAFVVINELFTTAANYDACIMGKRVLEHFLSQGCRGIYVTHLKELSDAHPRIVSLRAMLDERGVQNFRIERRAAQDSLSAVNLVNKHRLTYEQLKERLS